MKMGNSVKAVRVLHGYVVRVVFADGYVGKVDLAGVFDERPLGLVEQLRDPAEFRRVSVENNTLTFANGYDICADVLRFYCERGRVVSRRETDAAFARILAASRRGRAEALAAQRAEYHATPKRSRKTSGA
jgi:hypothetical protein